MISVRDDREDEQTCTKWPTRVINSSKIRFRRLFFAVDLSPRIHISRTAYRPACGLSSAGIKEGGSVQVPDLRTVNVSLVFVGLVRFEYSFRFVFEHFEMASYSRQGGGYVIRFVCLSVSHYVYRIAEQTISRSGRHTYAASESGLIRKVDSNPRSFRFELKRLDNSFRSLTQSSFRMD